MTRPSPCPDQLGVTLAQGDIKTVQGPVLKLFIDGNFVDAVGQGVFENINPATGQRLGWVARGEAEDVQRAVDAAENAYRKGVWANLPARERSEKLRHIGDMILEQKEALARAETLDTGKPIAESREGDIVRAAKNFHFFAEALGQLHEDSYTIDSQERHFSVREPLGVVGLITPWNLPMYLATWKIAPALAMGNSVVLKPAEWTPTTATLLAEIFQKAGIPAGVFNVVHGFGADGAGEALVKHPSVKAISFTGETSTGRQIMRTAADSLKKLSFELGGKGATVIFEDADLDAALEVAVKAAFKNQGQICLAGSRLMIHRNLWDRALPKLIAAVEAIRVGDPLSDATQMGALISAEHLEKVLSYIQQGKREGQLLTGGYRLESPAEDSDSTVDLSKGFFLKPTVFSGLPDHSTLRREEIFGPVLVVEPFESDEEAIERVNDTPYGLSVSVWSRDVNRCHRLSQAIRTGIVWVNCWFARDLRTPFGGMKASGMGREGGRHALEFFSEYKTVCYRYQG